MASRRIAGRTICSIAVAGLLAQPDAAGAQGVIHVRPLFSIGQAYDSNLFFSSVDRQEDFVTRTTPGLESDYRSPVLSLLGRYTQDIERYADHPDLNSVNTREHATVESTYQPARRLVLAAGAELAKTQAPGELYVETGFTFRRAAAQRITARSSIIGQFSRVTTGRMEYTFTGDHLAGTVGIRSHTAALSAEHSVSSHDTVLVGYRVQQFLFGTGGVQSASTTSHTLHAGWRRAISRRAGFSIDAGPQLANGAPAADVSAALHYHVKPVDLSLAYEHRLTTIIGLTGTARTQSVAGTAVWTFLRPSLQVQVSPAYFQSVHPLLRGDVYRLGVDVGHRITKGLSVGLALDMNLQRNRDAMLTRTDVPHQTAMIRLVAVPAGRL